MRIWYFDGNSGSNIFHMIAWEEQTHSSFVHLDPVFTWDAFKDHKIIFILSLHLSLLTKLLCHPVVSQALEDESQARSLTILTLKSMPRLALSCKGISKSSMPRFQLTSPAVLLGSSWTPRAGTADEMNQASSSLTVKHLKLLLQDMVRSRACSK